MKYSTIEKPCDLCGSTGYEVLWARKPWAQVIFIKQEDSSLVHNKDVICNNCGLVFKNPMMTKESLTLFYEKEYRKLFRIKRDKQETLSKLDISAEIVNAIMRLDWLKQIGFDFNNKLTLDIGCSLGIFATGMYDLGADVRGIEPNRQYGDFVKEWWEFPIEYVMFEDYQTDEKFDFITFTDGLEHVFSPTEVLKKIWHMLKPNGHLLIETNDIWYPYSTINAFFSSAHTYTFSEATMIAFLKKFGFAIVETSHRGHNKCLLILAKKAEVKLAESQEDIMPQTIDHKKEILEYFESYDKLQQTYRNLTKRIKDGTIELRDLLKKETEEVLKTYSVRFPALVSLSLALTWSSKGDLEMVGNCLDYYRDEGACDLRTSYANYLFYRGTLALTRQDLYGAYDSFKQAMKEYPQIDDYNFVNFLSLKGILMKDQIMGTNSNMEYCRQLLGRL